MSRSFSSMRCVLVCLLSLVAAFQLFRIQKSHTPRHAEATASHPAPQVFSAKHGQCPARELVPSCACLPLEHSGPLFALLLLARKKAGKPQRPESFATVPSLQLMALIQQLSTWRTYSAQGFHPLNTQRMTWPAELTLVLFLLLFFFFFSFFFFRTL